MNKKTRALTEEQYVEIIKHLKTGFQLEDGHLVRPNHRIAVALMLEGNLGVRIQHAKGRFYENLILTALGTGMRAGELLGLTWDDVDFRKREIRVNKTLVHIKDSETKKYVFKYQTPKTKNGTRTIPMQDSVYKALKRQYVQIKEMQLVFPDWDVLEGFTNLVFTTKTGRPVTERNFQVAVDNVAKAIDKERSEIAEQQNTEFVPIPHMYPHAFRHTFATRCFEAGIEAKIVQGYLGHYSTAITMDLYTHVTDDMAKKEMEKLNSLFAG